jgi:DNA-binding CsgD family transcriptional regulator
MSERCPTCGQPLPRSTDVVLPERELVALSAWWATGRYREAAMLAGVAVQTLKNQLLRARNRVAVHTTHELALMYLGRLRSKAELLESHNDRVAAGRRAA